MKEKLGVSYLWRNQSDAIKNTIDFFRILADQKDSIVVLSNSIVFIQDEKRQVILKSSNCLYIGDFFQSDSLQSDFADNNECNFIADGVGFAKYENGLVYRGEFKKNSPNGSGKLLNNAEKVLYDGQWKEGLRHGAGRENCEDGSIYIGEFEKGKPHGSGKLFNDKEELLYEGEWKNGIEDTKVDGKAVRPGVDPSGPSGSGMHNEHESSQHNR
jgi:hypothetical protein